MPKKTRPLSYHTRPLQWIDQAQRQVQRRLNPYQRQIRAFKNLVSAVLSLLIGFGLLYGGILLYGQPKVMTEYMPSDKTLKKWGFGQMVTLRKKGESLFRQLNNDTQSVLVRHNMEIMRLMLEAYKVEGRDYPDTVEKLYKSAHKRDFWRSLRNPYTLAFKGFKGSVDNFNEYDLAWEKTEYKGKLLYEPVGSPPNSYRIYACDDQGDLILNSEGVPYVLTPET